MTDEVIIQTLTDKVNFINDEVKRTSNNLADLIVCIDAEVLVHALKFIHRLQDENKGLMERGEIVINSLHETIDKQKDEIERQKDEFKTDYRNSWKNKFFTALKENRELQKQMDALKEDLERLDTVQSLNETLMLDNEELKEQRNVFKRLFESLNTSDISASNIIDIMNLFYREQAQHLAELKIEQAIKDAVKEILQELYNQIDENTPKWVGEQIKIIAKGKGVEVE